MNEYWAFALVFFGALAICLGGSYFLDGRLRKRMEEHTREVLSEARDNRVKEIQMGWGDGADPVGSRPEGINPDDDLTDDCVDCGGPDDE